MDLWNPWSLVHSQSPAQVCLLLEAFPDASSLWLLLFKYQDGKGLQGHLVQCLIEERLRPRESKRFSQSQPATQCEVVGAGDEIPETLSRVTPSKLFFQV